MTGSKSVHLYITLMNGIGCRTSRYVTISSSNSCC